MKYLLTTIVCLVISTSTSFAQMSERVGDKAIKHYLISLGYSNPGVVQSAIENIMIFNLNYPDGDYSKIIQKLEEMTLGITQKSQGVNACVLAGYLKKLLRYSVFK